MLSRLGRGNYCFCPAVVRSVLYVLFPEHFGARNYYRPELESPNLGCKNFRKTGQSYHYPVPLFQPHVLEYICKSVGIIPQLPVRYYFAFALVAFPVYCNLASVFGMFVNGICYRVVLRNVPFKIFIPFFVTVHHFTIFGLE